MCATVVIHSSKNRKLAPHTGTSGPEDYVAELSAELTSGTTMRDENFTLMNFTFTCLPPFWMQCIM